MENEEIFRRIKVLNVVTNFKQNEGNKRKQNNYCRTMFGNDKRIQI